eukprot:g9863.t1
MFFKTFILITATSTVVHRADATSFTTSSDICLETGEACGADSDCTECLFTVLNSGDEFNECAANYEFDFTEGEECSIYSAGPCCTIEVSGVDCLANDNWLAHTECVMEFISEGNCTSITCSGSTGAANDASSAGRSASKLNAICNAAAWAAAGVVMGAFFMRPALWV